MNLLHLNVKWNYRMKICSTDMCYKRASWRCTYGVLLHINKENSKQLMFVLSLYINTFGTIMTCRSLIVGHCGLESEVVVWSCHEFGVNLCNLLGT